MNYYEDNKQMTTLNLLASSKPYWLGTRVFRCPTQDMWTYEWGVCYVSNSENASTWKMHSYATMEYIVNGDGTYMVGNEVTMGLRAVFSINQDIEVISGEGTDADPYVIE